MVFGEFVVPGRSIDPSNTEAFGTFQQSIGLEQVSSSHLLGVLAQLTDVRKYAEDIFRDLHSEAQKTNEKIKSVRGRINQISSFIPQYQQLFHSSAPNCFIDSYPDKALSLVTNPKSGTFMRQKAPHWVNARRSDCVEPPNLGQLDTFAPCLDLKGKTRCRCLETYTYPKFFFDEWVKEENKKIENARKRRRKKKKKKKARPQEVEIEAFSVNRRDEFGNRVNVQVFGNMNVAQAGLGGYNVELQTTELQYGSNQLPASYGTQDTGPTSLYQPQAVPSRPKQVAAAAPLPSQPGQLSHTYVQPQMNTMTRSPGEPGPGAPPSAPMNAGPPQFQQRPPQPVQQQQQYAPPQPGPPQFQQAGPPQHRHAPQVGSAPPPQPAGPAFPEELVKYKKMAKRGVPPPGVMTAMRRDKIPNVDQTYDNWIDPAGPQGVGVPPYQGGGPPATPSGGPPAAPGGGPPAAPSGGPPRAPGGRGGFLDALKGPRKLKQSSGPPAGPKPSGNPLLDAIRKGKSLKDNTTRKIEPKPVDKRGGILGAIRGGIKLKKAKVVTKKQEEPEEENGIIAMLAQRKKLMEMSDSEDDSDGSSWDSDS